MTEQELSQYKILQNRKEHLLKKIEDEEVRELDAVAGKVKGSLSNHPYIETRFSVQMNDPRQEEESNRRIHEWEGEIRECEEKMKEIESFIKGIEDLTTRIMFRYRFIDGMNQYQVGDKMGLSQSVVSRRFSDFFKLA